MRRWLYNFIYLDFSFRKDKQNYHHIWSTIMIICNYHCYFTHIVVNYLSKPQSLLGVSPSQSSSTPPRAKSS